MNKVPGTNTNVYYISSAVCSTLTLFFLFLFQWLLLSVWCIFETLSFCFRQLTQTSITRLKTNRHLKIVKYSQSSFSLQRVWFWIYLLKVELFFFNVMICQKMSEQKFRREKVLLALKYFINRRQPNTLQKLN